MPSDNHVITRVLYRGEWAKRRCEGCDGKCREMVIGTKVKKGRRVIFDGHRLVERCKSCKRERGVDPNRASDLRQAAGIAA